MKKGKISGEAFSFQYSGFTINEILFELFFFLPMSTKRGEPFVLFYVKKKVHHVMGYNYYVSNVNLGVDRHI